MPGIIVPEGSPVTFNGTDILRITNGKATDYWVTSDITALLNSIPTTTP
jgi:hypothetical protein